MSSEKRSLPSKYVGIFGDNPLQRNWVCILYRDSTRADYAQVLDDYGFSWAESPLHDKDINDDGEQKKAHKHIVITMQGKRSFEFMDKVIQSLGIDDEHVPPVPIPCMSVKNSIRYFTHQDNPEKYQYDESEIKLHGAFNLDEYTKLTKAERNAIIREMIAFVIENKITEFADIVLYSSMHNEQWFEVLTSNGSYVMKEFIKSVRHGGITDFRKSLKIESDKQFIVDEDGVILDEK